jgi:sugar/nucleoside kinase (ribokinase family)
VDVFLPNETELAAITRNPDREAALRSLENGRTLTIAKLGADGCLALSNGSLVSIPAFPVISLDTTGAGDSFNAGFLHAWLRSEELAGALRFAAACGALSTLQSGGTTGQPTEEQTRQFMDRQPMNV